MYKTVVLRANILIFAAFEVLCGDHDWYGNPHNREHNQIHDRRQSPTITDKYGEQTSHFSGGERNRYNIVVIAWTWAQTWAVAIRFEWS